VTQCATRVASEKLWGIFTLISAGGLQGCLDGRIGGIGATGCVKGCRERSSLPMRFRAKEYP
jgi:hypothetical protein